MRHKLHYSASLGDKDLVRGTEFTSALSASAPGWSDKDDPLLIIPMSINHSQD